MTDMKAARVSAQIAFLLAALPTTALAQSTIRVDVTPGHAINAFDPDSALGSSCPWAASATRTGRAGAPATSACHPERRRREGPALPSPKAVLRYPPKQILRCARVARFAQDDRLAR